MYAYLIKRQITCEEHDFFHKTHLSVERTIRYQQYARTMPAAGTVYSNTIQGACQVDLFNMSSEQLQRFITYRFYVPMND